MCVLTSHLHGDAREGVSANAGVLMKAHTPTLGDTKKPFEQLRSTLPCALLRMKLHSESMHLSGMEGCNDTILVAVTIDQKVGRHMRHHILMMKERLVFVMWSTKDGVEREAYSCFSLMGTLQAADGTAIDDRQ